MNTTGSGRGWCHQICKPQRPRQPRTCWMLAVAFLVWSWLCQLLRFRQIYTFWQSFLSQEWLKTEMTLMFKVAQNQSNLELLSFLVSSVPASHTKWTEVPLLVTLFHYYSVQPASLLQCSGSGPHFTTRLKFRGRAIKMLTSVLPFYKCVDCIKQHFIFIEKLIF